ncbi:ubiquitin-like modifier-activating enzyme 6 [Brachionus plicatilis]|uniref:Ubiquitin-like modifier-activating enzyme 6 n=1 Tax=Brachionus plicatilis TaxID=10195 RepID=A0A3M7S9P4_BRAPC|nr:ubiquitin-like modifier-activating enzyme 6 [Brachionus plicatilis]
MIDIDNDLYSRQIYVLGNQAMQKLAKSKILLHSVGPLGVEIAKNLILAGIGSLSIIDWHSCSLSDLSSHFFIHESNVNSGVNRAVACLDQLEQLNPYVKVECLSHDIDLEDENFLKKFDCIIMTEEKNFQKLIKINQLCRENGVNFLLSNTFGLFGYSFTDFGDNFQVIDADGEDYKDVFISKITKDQNQFTVECLDLRNHNLESGDLIKITELKGLSELNDQIVKVSKIVNSFKFIFESDIDGVYERGGIFRKVKQSQHIQFECLEQQLQNPHLLFSDLNELKFENASLNHLFVRLYKSNDLEFETFLQLVSQHRPCEVKLEYFENLAKIFYDSQQANFSLYSSIFGGIVAQECLKSITNKFVPIKQWLFMDSSEMYESSEKLSLQNDRYDEIRKCFGGNDTLSKLHHTRLFMVGCGAIGCEMLKNYALVGMAKNGQITITDNDLIEKSNLNRQFLFRSKDIQRAKSVVAAEAASQINAHIKIKAMELKVCPQSESTFSDKFFQEQNVCVNALDNLEARRYMDSRCVTNQRALIESGTLGAKGHVQVILPFLTESYNSQKDPNESEGDVPYCTLKSFPSNIEHCIQWSRDKFESLFKIKPVMVNKFVDKNSNLTNLLDKLADDDHFGVEDLHKFCKFVRNYCHSYSDCLCLARRKFEKYFANKAKDILNIYPSDHLMNDGSPFWKLPKRQPNPIEFDAENELHLSFVTSLARLMAHIYRIDQTIEEKDSILAVLNSCTVPQWHPVKKYIETDETKKKNDQTKTKDLDNSKCIQIIRNFMIKQNGSNKLLNCVEFEKDNDKNGHIDFIHATSNLRATMYGLENADKLQVKKIAGKIVPAIATTTSVIAGLATIELIKVVQNDFKLDKFRNSFLNMAISLFLLSEPGPCPKTKITDDCCVTLWDKWTIKGNETFTLSQFIQTVKKNYKLNVSGIMYGAKSIYLPVMPGHAKRLNEKMLKLVKGVANLAALGNQSDKHYCDLHLTYQECDNDANDRDKNNLCPPIRYFFN